MSRYTKILHWLPVMKIASCLCLFAILCVFELNHVFALTTTKKVNDIERRIINNYGRTFFYIILEPKKWLIMYLINIPRMFIANLKGTAIMQFPCLNHSFLCTRQQNNSKVFTLHTSLAFEYGWKNSACNKLFIFGFEKTIVFLNTNHIIKD